MASKGVSMLKFVGTVSLGLLTGLSYTLSTLTVSTLLGLPSAASASKALNSVSASASRHLSILRYVSGSAFFTAFVMSPRSVRHPYLLYTSVIVFGAELADKLGYASMLTGSSVKKTAKKGKSAATPRGMEASYEVLGDAGSATSDGAPEEDEEVNGEEIKTEVEGFLKGQLIQGAVSGLGFLMAVVGIWGDGA